MKIPTYGSYGQVQRNTLPTVHQTAQTGDFGASHFNRTAGLLQGQSNITSQRILNSENLNSKTQARDNQNKTQQVFRDFYETSLKNNPKDNVDFSAKMDNYMKKVYKKSTKDMSGRTKAYYDLYFTKIAGDYKNKANQFQTMQQEQYKIDTLTAQNKQALDDVYAGVISMDSGLEIARANTLELNKHLPDEAVKLADQQVVDKFYVQYAKGLSQRRPDEAIQYIQDNRKEMTAETADEALKSLHRDSRHIKLINGIIPENEKQKKQMKLRAEELDYMSKDELMRIDLTKEKLRATDYKRLTALQDGLRKGDNEVYRAIAPWQSAKGYIQDLNLTEYQKTLYREEFNDWMNSKTKEQRNNIHDKEVGAWATDQVQKSNWWLQKNVHKFEVKHILDPEEKKDAENYFKEQEKQNSKIKFPEKLKIFGRALKYDGVKDRYFVEGDGIQHIYDNNGKYLGAKENKVSPKSKNLQKPAYYRDPTIPNWINNIQGTSKENDIKKSAVDENQSNWIKNIGNRK